MSAKDAPGEVKDKNNQIFNTSPNFDKSPNISSVDDEEQKAIAAAEAAQKQSETTLIDGIPISADEIKYKASDIRKKGKTEYFVNVEGAEQRKKEAIKKAREEALAAEAKDRRVIGELKKKASVRKKENLKAARLAARNSKKKKKQQFFKKHKISIIAAAIAIIVIVVTTIFIVSHLQEQAINTRIDEAAAEARKMVSDGLDMYKNDTSNTPEGNLIDFYEKMVAESKDDYDRQQRLLRYAQAIAQQARRHDLSNQVLDRLVSEFPEYNDDCEVLNLYRSNYVWMGDSQSAGNYDEVINNKCSAVDEG